MECGRIQAPHSEGVIVDSERLERLHGFEVSCAAKVRCRHWMAHPSYLWPLAGIVLGSVNGA